jgi:hypothetical protein
MRVSLIAGVTREAPPFFLPSRGSFTKAAAQLKQ